jgi:hypothetical protein
VIQVQIDITREVHLNILVRTETERYFPVHFSESTMETTADEL